MLWTRGSRGRRMLRRRGETTDLRWLSARAWTNAWYPQGVDVGVFRERRAVAVSWFQQDRDRTHLASRVVLIDADRARHIDAALVVPGDDGALEPARIHAGGIAWFEDRLFVAATGQGIWEFDLGAIRRVRRFWKTTLLAVRTRVHPIDLRCSFIGRVYDASGAPLRRVLIGEFRDDDRGRIGEFTIPDGPEDGFAPQRRFAPGIPHMQGAVRWGDRTFVSQSAGMKPGTLWTGPGESLVPHTTPLPVGCEDLALDPEGRMLWSVGEHPRQRVVRGIPFASVGIEAGS